MKKLIDIVLLFSITTVNVQAAEKTSKPKTESLEPITINFNNKKPQDFKFKSTSENQNPQPQQPKNFLNPDQIEKMKATLKSSKLPSSTSSNLNQLTADPADVSKFSFGSEMRASKKKKVDGLNESDDEADSSVFLKQIKEQLKITPIKPNGINQVRPEK